MGVILEHGDKYPKKVKIDCWGELVDTVKGLQNGYEIKIHYNDPESKEYNGKWYTDIKAWKIETKAFHSANQSPQAGTQAPQPKTAPVAELPSYSEEDQDLPF
jgi:hypothetical protein